MSRTDSTSCAYCGEILFDDQTHMMMGEVYHADCLDTYCDEQAESCGDRAEEEIN